MKDNDFQAKLAEQLSRDKQVKERLRLEADSWLCRFKTELTISDFDAILSEFGGEYSRVALDTPQTGFYRDAYLALMMARTCDAETLWLGENPPDFYLKRSGHSVSFEATEIIRPGRKRGNDMRELAVLRTRSERDQDVISKENLLKLVSENIRRKNEYQYTDVNGLVLYVNVGRLDAKYYTREIVDDFYKSCAELDFKNCIFNHVWVIYSHYVRKVYGDNDTMFE